MEKKPALEVMLVQEFVSKSHADLEGIKELLVLEPGTGVAETGRPVSALPRIWADMISQIICLKMALILICSRQLCSANWRSSKL